MGIDKNTTIFDGISFSEIAKEIWTKKKEKDTQIELLINELKPFIKNISDAAMLIPLLKEYMDIGVKNDEILVKLAGIIQKLITSDGKSDTNSGEYGLTDSEKQQLLKEAESLHKEIIKPVVLEHTNIK